MAPLPDHMVPKIEDAFLADRAMFWGRFTTFSKYAIGIIIVLLVLIYLVMG